MLKKRSVADGIAKNTSRSEFSWLEILIYFLSDTSNQKFSHHVTEFMKDWTGSSLSTLSSWILDWQQFHIAWTSRPNFSLGTQRNLSDLWAWGSTKTEKQWIQHGNQTSIWYINEQLSSDNFVSNLLYLSINMDARFYN